MSWYTFEFLAVMWWIYIHMIPRIIRKQDCLTSKTCWGTTMCGSGGSSGAAAGASIENSVSYSFSVFPWAAEKSVTWRLFISIPEATFPQSLLNFLRIWRRERSINDLWLFQWQAKNVPFMRTWWWRRDKWLLSRVFLIAWTNQSCSDNIYLSCGH